MIDKVRAHILKYQMIHKGDTIILGISGGADSVCLLFVLLELQVEYDLQIIGVHINHNLRGAEALRDQEYVEHICKEQGVPCTVFSVDVKKEACMRKRSLEEAGREVRQEAFAQVSGQVKGNVKIATAHHSNDNAETLLMNLARGTGISGLTGIAPIRGNRIRPLLGVSRLEIEQYLESRGIAYCTDSTNQENIYTRNIIRNEVVPCMERGVNEQAVAHMNQTMEEMERIEWYLQEQISELWKQCVWEDREKGGVIICKEGFAELADIMKERIMKRAIEQVAGAQRDIMRVHIQQLVGLQEKQVGREVHLPYQLIGRKVYEGVEIYPKEMEENRKKSLGEGMELSVSGKTHLEDGNEVKVRILEGNVTSQIQEKPYTKYFDYDIITEAPRIRTRNMGDYIVINNKGNKQTLKKYYITNKIPEILRDSIPVIAIGNQVLWIIGYRKSSGYEVNENTKRVLEIEYNGGSHGRNN